MDDEAAGGDRKFRAAEAVYLLEGVQVVAQSRVILDAPFLAIDAGEICAVVGPNGAGKTTLLRLLAFLNRPGKGILKFMGRDVSASSSVPLDVRRKVTMVMQDPYIFRGTVFRNACFGAKAAGVSSRESAAAAERALDLVGLSELKSRPARSLSGGEAKRLAIARAIAAGTETLLLDEPSANVDEENLRFIEDVLLSMNHDRGVTIVLSTHDENQALRLSSRIFRLSSGALGEERVDNVFRGEVSAAGGSVQFRVAETELKLAGGRTGRALAHVDPSSVSISLEPMRTSALNVLEGEIIEAVSESDRVRVVIRAGISITAHVTKESAERMELAEGKKAFAVFKAHSVELIG